MPMVDDAAISVKDTIQRLASAETVLKASGGVEVAFGSSAAALRLLKDAKDALMTSENMCRLILEKASEAAFVVQGESIIFANPRAAEIFQRSRDEIESACMEDLLQPEPDMWPWRGRRSYQGYLQRSAFQAGRGCSYPHHLEERPSLLIFLKDITENRYAEEARKEMEAEYRDLFENSSDLIQMVHPDGRLAYVNRAWREALGYSEEEIADLYIFKVIHPHSRAHCADIFPKVLSGERFAREELELKSRDGRKIIVEGNISCRFKDGRPYHIRCICRDVTEDRQVKEALHRANEELEQKVQERTSALLEANLVLQKEIRAHSNALRENEQLVEQMRSERAMFKAVLKQMPAGILIADADGKVLLGNDQMKGLWRIQSLPAAGIQEYHQEYMCYHPDGRPYALEERPLARSVFRGEVVQGEEMHIRRGDRSRGIVMASSAPMKDARGMVIGGVVTFYDITEHKRTEEELKSARKELGARITERTAELLRANRALQAEIVDRGKAEEMLRRSEVLLRSMAENSPLAFFVVDDRTDSILYFNSRFCKLWGLESMAEEMRAGEIKSAEVIPRLMEKAEDPQAIGALCAHTKQEGLGTSGTNATTVEDEIKLKDGRTIRRFLAQIKDLQRNPFARLYICEEITERKRVEEELRLAHSQLQDIIEFLPDATFVVDKYKKVIAWNRAIEEMTGVKKEEIVGKGDYCYAVPFYGTPRPILVDLIDTYDEKLASQYLYLARKGDTLYGESFMPRGFGGREAYLWAKASHSWTAMETS